MLYWSMSTVLVLLSQRLTFDFFAQPLVSLSIALLVPALFFTRVGQGKTVTHLAWMHAVYGFIFAASRRYIQPILLGDAVDMLTARETLVFHWSLAFFVISEAEWHQHFYKTMAHPVCRDIMPAGNCKASNICRTVGMLAMRVTLAMYIPIGLIILIAGVKIPSMAPSVVLASWRTVSSTPPLDQVSSKGVRPHAAIASTHGMAG